MFFYWLDCDIAKDHPGLFGGSIYCCVVAAVFIVFSSHLKPLELHYSKQTNARAHEHAQHEKGETRRMKTTTDEKRKPKISEE